MLPKIKNVINDPGFEDLQKLVAEMPTAVKTNRGNYSVNTKVTARSPESTFFVSNTDTGHPCMSSSEYQRLAQLQDEYIAGNKMVSIEGSIGPDADFQVGCRLLIEKSFANIGAMQQQLYFPRSASAQKELTIIHTPGLSVPGYPNDRVITVDLETYTTRIMGSDYFGEAKKGGLRMWNQWVCDAGGLGVHAGCKVYPDIHGEEKLVLIIGLSGTGKTATVFRSQLGSLPVQDDFCAFMPGGSVRATENGCFAKTYQLDGKNEPVIFNALTQPESWLENVSVSRQGGIDFFDGSHTTNGRGTFRLDQINHRSPSNLPKISSIIFLNRNFNIIPAVVKLKPEQAAAYFMLGETTGTSAGGSSEAGKFLRVPGTNPFFCQQDFIQGNRFYDLLKSNTDINVFLFNTGCVGGREGSGQAKKVGIRDSSAILEAVMLGTVLWKEDSQFGYEVAEHVPGIEDEDLLQPERLYAKQGREVEYAAIAEQINKDRTEYINQFDGLYDQIKKAI